MAKRSRAPVKTFSMGFDERDFSEVPFARQVAERYDTEHHEEIVRPDAAQLLPTLVRQYGEPFADPSAVPTYLLCKMTRRNVTVALSGDGADEAFAGYRRYLHERLARVFQRLPSRLAVPLAKLIERHLPGRKAGWVGELAADVRQHAGRMQLDERARYLTQFGNFSTDQLEGLLAAGQRERHQRDAERLFERLLSEGNVRHSVDRLLDLDSRCYLPDDILVKVDIASMAHSLEVRSPFLDHRLLEFIATLPAHHKLFGFRGKWLLRKAVSGLLPPSILRRGKQGFGIPHARWLRNELRPMLRDALLSPRALQRGYFERAAVERLLQEHDHGHVNHGLRLWNLLWLELWHREFVDARS